jgi:1-acyl-sn-glycerol-3-phosphate acyltransferase
MIAVRSFLFAALFYLWSLAMGLAMIPLLLGPRRWMLWAMTRWADGIVPLLRFIAGIQVEMRGMEHLPKGAALIAAKHQCMFDTMGPFRVFDDACYVMRDELLSIPFYGWYCRKAGMIAIDRDAGAKALRSMVAAAKAGVAEGRQLVIFPEGHRMGPGETGEYKPGVAALYRAVGLPCIPMATNSGVHWPAHGFLRRPGRIVYEFLPPIPPGLNRAEFMATLETRLEAASKALLSE